MFIKRQFEDKLKKQSETLFGPEKVEDSPRRITKNFQIGSKWLPRMNYERDEEFFTKEHIPSIALQAKHNMKDLVDPDLLGLRKKQWVASVSIPRNILAEEDFQRKLTKNSKIKMGLHDHPMPKFKDKKIEPGCDTRNNYTGWNVSTELMTPYERNQMLKKEQSQIYGIKDQNGTLSKQNKTIQFNNNKYDSSHYKTPTETIIVKNEELREKKRMQQQIREELTKQYEFEHPKCTTEKVRAGVFRMLYENEVRNAKPQSDELFLNLTFKPNMTQTLRHKFQIKAYHNGNWGTNKLSPDIEVWSCCMDTNKNSEGCIRINQDKEKWNLASIG